ncbi:MAG: toll/interleukin-1 receptor domain-containing protein [Pseudomonadota bacterium]
MNKDFIFDMFLSHRSRDKTVVCEVAERMRQVGLKVRFDEWELKPGDSTPAKIEEVLERSRVLVLCMSAQAFGSNWAQLETDTFRFRDPLNHERRFIPLRLDDAGHAETAAEPDAVGKQRRVVKLSKHALDNPFYEEQYE